MKMRTLAVLALVASLTPSTLHACSCVITGLSGTPHVERPWSDRAQIFIGHVLEVDWTRSSTARLTVRFVTEASWRGPMPDTVTLNVRPGAPCAYYTAGSRYLVLADTASGGALVTARCDYSWGMHHEVTKNRIAELGPPVWRAPPMGSRALDAHARVIGTPISRTFTEGSVAFVPPQRNNDVALFEIGDWGRTGLRPGGPVLYAQPGLYQFRITWADGSSYASYVSLRCDRDKSPDRCQSFIFFGGLR